MYRSSKALEGGLALIAVLGLLIGALLAMPLAAEEADKTEELPLRFNAIAANMSNWGRPGQARIDIQINRWSEPEEREILLEALKQNRRRSLPEALFDRDSVGTIREIQKLANDLRYSRQIPLEDGGRQIILALDRPLAMAELRGGSRTLDYNVTLVVLNLDKEGKGEGLIALGAEFAWDEEKQQLAITNFASEPLRLTTVSQRK